MADVTLIRDNMIAHKALEMPGNHCVYDCDACLSGESPVKLRKRKAKEENLPEPDAQTSPVVARRSSRRHSKRQVLQSDDEDEVQHVDVKQQVSVGPQPCKNLVLLLA